MSSQNDTEQSQRRDAIVDASLFYDLEESNAIAAACEDIPQLMLAGQEILHREDLTTQQKREIASTLSTDIVSFSIPEETDGDQCYEIGDYSVPDTA